MDKAPLWPIGFFYKGLVIHVVFSLVIWLLGVFAFLTTVATREAAGGAPRGRGPWADRAGRRARRLSLPVRAGLFRPGPAGADQLCPALAPSRLRRRPRPAGARGAGAGSAPVPEPAGKTVPADADPVDGAGRLRLRPGAGVLGHSRGYAGAGGTRSSPTGRRCSGAAATCCSSSTRSCFSATGRFSRGSSLGEKAVQRRGLPRRRLQRLRSSPFPGRCSTRHSLPSPHEQHEAFRLLQFGLALPTLAGRNCAGAQRPRRARGRPWPWRDPAFFTLAASLALFALGGVMGFRSPAPTPGRRRTTTRSSPRSACRARGCCSPSASTRSGFGPVSARVDPLADRLLRRRPVRRLDRHVRRRRLRRAAQDAERGRLARSGGGRGHGGARGRLHLHHPRRSGLRHCSRSAR